MRLGLQVPIFTWPNGQSQLGQTFGEIAERAERAGLYSLWVMDHFFQIGFAGPPENEPYQAGYYGHRCHLPLPRYPGEDRHYP